MKNPISEWARKLILCFLSFYVVKSNLLIWYFLHCEKVVKFVVGALGVEITTKSGNNETSSFPTDSSTLSLLLGPI